MSDWLKRVRAAVGMGLTWAVAWAPIGILIGIVFGGNVLTPDEFPQDDWMMPFALAGFLGGGLFSGVLRLLGQKRRFDELSLPRFGAWGAIGGFVAGGLMVARWAIDGGWGPVFLEGALGIVGATTVMAAISASGTLAIARKGEDRQLASSKVVDAVELSEHESPELLG